MWCDPCLTCGGSHWRCTTATTLRGMKLDPNWDLAIPSNLVHVSRSHFQGAVGADSERSYLIVLSRFLIKLG